MDGKKKRQSLSLAELKKRRDEERARQLKPVFMSREQREHMKRMAEVEKRVEAKGGGANASLDEGRPEMTERRPRAQCVSKRDDVQIDVKERQAIEKHYMRTGAKPMRENGKRPSKVSDKLFFRFDWDNADDTTKDEDELRVQLRRKMEESALKAGRGRPDASFGGSSSRRKHGRGESSGGPVQKRAKKRKLYDSRLWSEKPRDEMTDRDWRIFREDYLISVRGGNAARPARNWTETGLPDGMLHRVMDMYEKPSPIQMATIPICLQARDVIGLAETGSGKTAAYVLPMLAYIAGLPKLTAELAARGPYALVMAPTRELAQQIDLESRKFAVPMGYRVTTVIGGADLDAQALQLQLGSEIVICTPGRMADLLARRMAALGNCTFVVLDEADRMVDMGFEPKVLEILGAMPDQIPEADVVDSRKRQTLMFSATMVPAVERLARSYLLNPVVVTIGETGQAADNVEQRVEFCETEGRRKARLVQLLQTLESPVLVFVNTKSGCETVARHVENVAGIRPVVMHSGKSQEVREANLEGFRTGYYEVMIATDVLGRGIDIKGIKNVVNYEVPGAIDTYTHRIGRTGRAGEKGTAWSLTTAVDAEIFPALREVLDRAGASIPDQIARADAFGFSRNGRQQVYGKPIVD